MSDRGDGGAAVTSHFTNKKTSCTNNINNTNNTNNILNKLTLISDTVNNQCICQTRGQRCSLA